MTEIDFAECVEDDEDVNVEVVIDLFLHAAIVECLRVKSIDESGWVHVLMQLFDEL